MSELLVQFRDRLVGRAIADARDRFAFDYAPEWQASRRSFPISLRLPLRQRCWTADLDKNLAMAIGGERNPDRLRLRHFHQLAADIGIRPRKVEQEADRMLANIDEALASATGQLRETVGYSPAAEWVERAIRKRVRAIGNNVKQDRG